MMDLPDFPDWWHSMSKVYLAARYSRHPEMRGYRDDLEAMGHKVTARWIDCHTDVVGDFTSSFTQEFLNANPEKCGPLGQHDIDDLDAAEWVVSFTGGGLKGGRHVEFGYALATGKRLVVVGPRENVFHTLASVEHFEDWPAARAALAESTVEPVRADPASDDLQVLGEEHAECVAGYHLLRKELVERTRELAEAVRMVKLCTGHPDTGLPAHADLVAEAKRERDEARDQVVALEKQVERQNRLLLGADQGLAEFQGQRDKAIGLLHRLVVAAGCTWDPLRVPALVDEAEGWIRDYMGTAESSRPAAARVWQKGDPEPPADVVLLALRTPTTDGARFVKRTPGGDWWFAEAPEETTDPEGWSWEHVWGDDFDQPLTEVVEGGGSHASA